MYVCWEAGAQAARSSPAAATEERSEYFIKMLS
jgi:hypothetical protein